MRNAGSDCIVRTEKMNLPSGASKKASDRTVGYSERELNPAIQRLRQLCEAALEDPDRVKVDYPPEQKYIDESEPLLKASKSRPACLAPLREYDLIRYCSQCGAFDFLQKTSPATTLFYKHFLIMHCLYSLQGEGLRKRRYLQVNPLAIGWLADAGSQADTELDASSGSLAGYYLDLGHLQNVTDDSVQDLLANFWKLFHANDAEDDALRTLGLAAEADWPQIQRRYRKLVASAHPDKGGRQEDFIRIQQAYESLAIKHSRS